MEQNLLSKMKIKLMGDDNKYKKIKIMKVMESL